MGIIRRASVAATVVSSAVIATAGAAAGAQVSRSPLVLTSTSTPGSLRIVNASVATVTITRPISVEELKGTSWVPFPTEFNAVAVCQPSARTPTVHLPPGATLNVVPWQGGSCLGQCIFGCRANRYFGGGRFRFVVTQIPGGRAIGPVFTMPPRRPSGLSLRSETSIGR